MGWFRACRLTYSYDCIIVKLMINCENCPALQYCGREVQEYTAAGNRADEQAARFEEQELAMRFEVIKADDALEKGDMSELRHSAIERFAEEVAANNTKPEVASTPLRAEFWRQEAEHAQATADTIKAGCSGLPKLRANMGHLLGKSVCASTAPEAQLQATKWNAGLRPIT